MLDEMFSEQEKAAETIKWMVVFNRMVDFADQSSISHQSFYNILKGEINSVIRLCNKVIEDEK